jgi:voltage-gated potassium channel
VIAVIVASVMVVILDSVEAVRFHLGSVFGVLKRVFTALFTVEYVGRLMCVWRPLGGCNQL